MAVQIGLLRVVNVGGNHRPVHVVSFEHYIAVLCKWLRLPKSKRRANAPQPFHGHLVILRSEAEIRTVEACNRF